MTLATSSPAAHTRPDLPNLHVPSTEPWALPVGIYARLSENPDGTSDSVPVQLAGGSHYATQRWPGRPQVEFSDDDITAADDEVYRPGYEAMLDAVRRGQIGDVVARNQSRISRHEVIWPAFKVTMLSAGIRRLCSMQGGDVSLAEGQSLPGDIMNLVNAEYAKQTKLNINDALDERARQGRPSGGRCYGYRHRRNEAGVSELVIVPEQADAIRFMVKLVTAGASLAEVCRALAERGIKAPRAGTMMKQRDGVRRPASDQWEPGALRGLLLRPTLIGLRQHRGAIVGKGNWEPILTEGEQAAVRAILEAPRVVKRSDGIVTTRKVGRRASRKYLVTGELSWCGRCHTALTAGPVDGVPNYLCHSKNGGCNGIGIGAKGTELVVEEALMAFLDSPEFEAYIAAADVDHERRVQIDQEMLAIDARLADIGRLVMTGAFTAEVAQGAAEEAVKQKSALGQELASLSPPPMFSDPDLLRSAWSGMELPERRAVLFFLDCRVVVLPAFGPRVWNPDRVVVTFGKASSAAREALEAERAKPRRKSAATRTRI